ncbi:hypothetical protein BH23PAT1_BH23PAT1_2550 [soil metagenome]
MRGTLAEYLKKLGYEVVDDGDFKLDPDDDFPVFAQKVARDVISSDDGDARGILICGSGQGMCMAANRFKGIRASLGYNRDAARSVRNDDDSNILCVPVNTLTPEEVKDITDVWLTTAFSGITRYKRRIREMDEMN